MKKSVSVFKNIFLSILSLSVLLTSCSKDKEMAAPQAVSFAGQYLVVDDTETYTLKVENKGGNNFQIIEFGGFINAPVKAVLEGNVLTIHSQTFTNPNGSKLTVVGKGVLSTKSSKDDTISFQYTLTGFVNSTGDFEGKRL